MDSRDASSAAAKRFNDVKEQRCAVFREAFEYIKERIDGVYEL